MSKYNKIVIASIEGCETALTAETALDVSILAGAAAEWYMVSGCPGLADEAFKTQRNLHNALEAIGYFDIETEVEP